MTNSTDAIKCKSNHKVGSQQSRNVRSLKVKEDKKKKSGISKERRKEYNKNITKEKKKEYRENLKGKSKIWEADRRKRFNDAIDSLGLELPNNSKCSKIDIIKKAIDFVKSHKECLHINNRPVTQDLQNKFEAKCEALETECNFYMQMLNKIGITIKKNDENILYTLPKIFKENESRTQREELFLNNFTLPELSKNIETFKQLQHVGTQTDSNPCQNAQLNNSSKFNSQFLNIQQWSKEILPHNAHEVVFEQPVVSESVLPNSNEKKIDTIINLQSIAPISDDIDVIDLSMDKSVKGKNNANICIKKITNSEKMLLQKEKPKVTDSVCYENKATILENKGLNYPIFNIPTHLINPISFQSSISKTTLPQFLYVGNKVNNNASQISTAPIETLTLEQPTVVYPEITILNSKTNKRKQFSPKQIVNNLKKIAPKPSKIKPVLHSELVAQLPEMQYKRKKNIDTVIKSLPRKKYCLPKKISTLISKESSIIKKPYVIKIDTSRKRDFPESYPKTNYKIKTLPLSCENTSTSSDMEFHISKISSIKCMPVDLSAGSESVISNSKPVSSVLTSINLSRNKNIPYNINSLSLAAKEDVANPRKIDFSKSSTSSVTFESKIKIAEKSEVLKNINLVPVPNVSVSYHTLPSKTQALLTSPTASNNGPIFSFPPLVPLSLPTSVAMSAIAAVPSSDTLTNSILPIIVSSSNDVSLINSSYLTHVTTNKSVSKELQNFAKVDIISSSSISSLMQSPSVISLPISTSIFSLTQMPSYSFPFCGLSNSETPTSFSFTLTKTTDTFSTQTNKSLSASNPVTLIKSIDTTNSDKTESLNLNLNEGIISQNVSLQKTSDSKLNCTIPITTQNVSFSETLQTLVVPSTSDSSVNNNNSVTKTLVSHINKDTSQFATKSIAFPESFWLQTPVSTFPITSVNTTTKVTLPYSHTVDSITSSVKPVNPQTNAHSPSLFLPNATTKVTNLKFNSVPQSTEHSSMSMPIVCTDIKISSSEAKIVPKNMNFNSSETQKSTAISMSVNSSTYPAWNVITSYENITSSVLPSTNTVVCGAETVKPTFSKTIDKSANDKFTENRNITQLSTSTNSFYIKSVTSRPNSSCLNLGLPVSSMSNSSVTTSVTFETSTPKFSYPYYSTFDPSLYFSHSKTNANAVSSAEAKISIAYQNCPSAVSELNTIANTPSIHDTNHTIQSKFYTNLNIYNVTNDTTTPSLARNSHTFTTSAISGPISFDKPVCSYSSEKISDKPKIKNTVVSVSCNDSQRKLIKSVQSEIQHLNTFTLSDSRESLEDKCVSITSVQNLTQTSRPVNLTSASVALPEISINKIEPRDIFKKRAAAAEASETRSYLSVAEGARLVTSQNISCEKKYSVLETNNIKNEKTNSYEILGNFKSIKTSKPDKVAANDLQEANINKNQNMAVSKLSSIEDKTVKWQYGKNLPIQSVHDSKKSNSEATVRLVTTSSCVSQAMTLANKKFQTSSSNQQNLITQTQFPSKNQQNIPVSKNGGISQSSRKDFVTSQAQVATTYSNNQQHPSYSTLHSTHQITSQHNFNQPIQNFDKQDPRIASNCRQRNIFDFSTDQSNSASKNQQQNIDTSSYMQPIDYYPYYKKSAEFSRFDARQQCYGYARNSSHYDLNNSNLNFQSQTAPSYIDGSDDLSMRIVEETPTDNLRYFSVSHLVGPFNEPRKNSKVETQDAKLKDNRFKTNIKKIENRSKGVIPNSKVHNSQSELKSRSPVRSNTNTHESNDNFSMWNKNVSHKQGSYSAEALIGSQNYAKASQRAANQNYCIPNQMYQTSYASQSQMRTFPQNSTFGFNVNDRVASNADYNLQFQGHGSFSYGSNMPYMSSGPYQTPSSFLPGDLMPSHSSTYTRFQDINSDPSSFSSNAFSLQLDSQDLSCVGQSLISSNEPNINCPRTDLPFSVSTSNSKHVGKNSIAVSNATNTDLKRPRFNDNIAPSITPNFLDSSSLSHIPLHSFTPPCDENYVHSNFFSSSNRQQGSNFFLGSDFNSSNTQNFSDNIVAITTLPNPTNGLNAMLPSNPNTFVPHSNFNLPKADNRPQVSLQYQTPYSMPSHFSSTLSNFNLTSIIPEIGSKNSDTSAMVQHSRSATTTISNSSATSSMVYPSKATAVMPNSASISPMISGSSYITYNQRSSVLNAEESNLSKTSLNSNNSPICSVVNQLNPLSQNDKKPSDASCKVTDNLDNSSLSKKPASSYTLPPKSKI